MKAPTIGSTVRVSSKVVVPPKPGPKRRGGGGDILNVARRCIVATLPDENGCISLVQDDLAPAHLPRRGKFMIAPMFNSVGVEVKECEVEASEVMPLLAFEFEEGNHKEVIDVADDAQTIVQRYKEHGDQLLRLNDYTCAISYYEAALHSVSSQFDVIGGTLVVKKKGHSVIAEVDCVDTDEKHNNTFDVTYLSCGEEAEITQNQILLAVWVKDVTFIQTKLLLNLSRCLLKLAQLDNTRGNASCVGESSSAKNCRQDRYRLSAVKGVSIAITLCEYHLLESSDDSSSELKSLIEKARIVRSRAFLGVRKLPNAAVDAKKVLAQNPANREASALLCEIKAVEAYNKSVDKKISREVAKWVHTATSSSSGAEAMGRVDDSVSEDEREEEDENGGDAEPEYVKPARTQYSYDSAKWQMARRVSMEAFGVVAFLIAMFVLYPKSDQKL